jgi:hypothetical protein
MFTVQWFKTLDIQTDLITRHLENRLLLVLYFECDLKNEHFEYWSSPILRFKTSRKSHKYICVVLIYSFLINPRQVRFSNGHFQLKSGIWLKAHSNSTCESDYNRFQMVFVHSITGPKFKWKIQDIVRTVLNQTKTGLEIKLSRLFRPGICLSNHSKTRHKTVQN